MASPIGCMGIIEIHHTCDLQDGIANSGVPEYILKTFLDVNNPTGALVFVCVVGGMLVVFIAILDSLKPPNFPPGPRWLPFGGDSSAVSEKPLTKTTAAKLLKQFGPVVGLRRKNGHRNPVILALDVVSAETVEQAARQGFLQLRNSECPELKISEFTGIPHSFRLKINATLMSEDTKYLIENSTSDSVRNLFDVLTNKPQELNSSLISKVVLAVLLNVVTGRRVKLSSPYLIHLHEIVVRNSILDSMWNESQWTEDFDNSSYIAQRYSKLTMILSDLDEDTNHTSEGTPEKCSIMADILISANIGHYLPTVDEILDILNIKYRQVQPRTEHSFNSSSKDACYKFCESLIYNLSKRLPFLNIRQRWEVHRSFHINGFTVPQGSDVQTVLPSHQEYDSISDERIPYKDFMLSLLSIVLSEIVFWFKSGNVMNQ